MLTCKYWGKLWGELAIVALLWTSVCFGQTLPRTERPNVKVGDSSVYRESDLITGETRDTTFAITAIAPDKIVTQTSGSTSGTRTFTRDFNIVEVKTGQLVTMTATPFWPYLQFPLEVGRQWDLPFTVDVTVAPSSRHAAWQWKARVAAVETVTVPAGKFPAYRIEYDAKFHSSQNGVYWDGTQQETAWYAPAVNRIVKREYQQAAVARGSVEQRRIELVSFRPGP